MATYTPNLNLKKPDYTDLADVADFNANMDIIDGQISTLDADIDEHKADNVPHQYGNRFAWEYNSITDSLDLVVIE